MSDNTKALTEGVAVAILSSWTEWEAEAGMAAQVEQDSRAYEDTMMGKLMGVLKPVLQHAEQNGRDAVYEDIAEGQDN